MVSDDFEYPRRRYDSLDSDTRLLIRRNALSGKCTTAKCPDGTTATYGPESHRINGCECGKQ